MARTLVHERGLATAAFASLGHVALDPEIGLPRPGTARGRDYVTLELQGLDGVNAVFALRAALLQFDTLLDKGLPAESIEPARGYLRGFPKLLVDSPARRIAAALDDVLMQRTDRSRELAQEAGKQSRDEIEGALVRHLALDAFKIVIVGGDARGIAAELISGAPTPPLYPEESLDGRGGDIEREDERIAAWPLPIEPSRVTIVSRENLFRSATPAWREGK